MIGWRDEYNDMGNIECGVYVCGDVGISEGIGGIMRKEGMKYRVYYGFDNVPIQVSGGYTISPCHQMVLKLGTKNVSEWIGWLFERAEKSSSHYVYAKFDIVYVCVWNTGYGNYIVL